MTWLPTCTGLSVELVVPRVVEVDFDEIAHALCHTNRSAGNSADPVSVGLHTLIGLDFCSTPTLRAKWLVHDAHEARLGDTTTPYKEAAQAVAEAMYGREIAEKLAGVRRELEARHDAAIFEAAGLGPPDPVEKQALKAIDLKALATERRDFYRRGPAPRPWLIDRLGIEPGSKVWRWMPPHAVRCQLAAAFRNHLPALKSPRRAAPSTGARP